MTLTGPGFFYLSQVKQLATPAERLHFLESKTADGSLDLANATEIAREVQLPDPSLKRLMELGRLVGSTPLFVPGFAEHRRPSSGGYSSFGLRLQTMMDKPAASSTQEAIQRVVDRHRSLLHSFGPRERIEWGLIVRLTKSQVKDPVALEAGLENIAGELGANRVSTQSNRQRPDIDTLQNIRRGLLMNIMNGDDFDAVYRYTRDNAINATLRQFSGKDNIPGHEMSSTRPALSSVVQGSSRHAYEPKSNVTTGHFIYTLDHALNTLKEIQGQDKSTLYRATLFRRPWVDSMIQSGQFMDHGYVSTSRYQDKLLGFFRNEWSTRFDDEVPVLMVFETNKSVDLSCLSRFTNESEHLIPRDERFSARFIGYRRDMCAGLAVADSENWAVFVMTDDDHVPAAQTIRSIEELAKQGLSPPGGTDAVDAKPPSGP
jgi:hypothetical protein